MPWLLCALLLGAGLAQAPAEDGGGGRADKRDAAAYNYAEALQKAMFFFECQRSGVLTDGHVKNRVEWRGDSALVDGQEFQLDLSGGFFDAGDGVKFGFPMASSLTLMAWGLMEFPHGHLFSQSLPFMLESLKWGADYLLKCAQQDRFFGQCGKGSIDHAYWGPPEKMDSDAKYGQRPCYYMTPANPGTELTAETAAALAAISMAWKRFHPADVAFHDLLFNTALRLWGWSDQPLKQTYTVPIPDAYEYYRSWSGYHDELAWAGAWLYQACQQNEGQSDRCLQLLDSAERYYNEHFQPSHEEHSIDEKYEPLSWDCKWIGASVLLAKITRKQQYVDWVHTHLDWWATKDGKHAKYTPGGLAFFAKWGSLRYAANTALVAFIWSEDLRSTDMRRAAKYFDFGSRQINYMLGTNPMQRSLVVGFGHNPPVRVHHRAASGKEGWGVDGFSSADPNLHTIYGALVGGPYGGPTCTDPNLACDFYEDDRTDAIRNEVAMDYNAGFVGGLARMVQEYGGIPLQEFCPGKKCEYFPFTSAPHSTTAHATRPPPIRGSTTCSDGVDCTLLPVRKVHDEFLEQHMVLLLTIGCMMICGLLGGVAVVYFKINQHYHRREVALEQQADRAEEQEYLLH